MGRAVLLFLVVAGLGACAHAKIPRTDIDDTPDNRAIIDIIKTYHTAIENRDADAVLSLVSPRYYEDNGNTDRSDDYDYYGLKDQLGKEFAKSRKIQLELKVDAITVDDKNDKAYAFIDYTYKAQTDFPVGARWKTASDRARISFAKEHGRWMIVAGL